MRLANYPIMIKRPTCPKHGVTLQCPVCLGSQPPKKGKQSRGRPRIADQFSGIKDRKRRSYLRHKAQKRAVKSKVVTLPISKIRLDFQPGENLIPEVVQKYIEDGGPFDPLTVKFDGTNYFLEDGFHRLEAARRLGHTAIDAEVSPGTLADMEANFAEYLKQLKRQLRK